MVVLLALYYAAFTVYVGPYLALIPEIAWSEDERVRLSALLGIVSFPALALYGAAWPAGVALGRCVEFGIEQTFTHLEASE